MVVESRMRQKLSDLEIQRALGTLTGWSRRGDVLTKTFTFDKFARGSRSCPGGGGGGQMDHHPDIDIRYTKITMTLSTHDAGGITQADLDLAQKIERRRPDDLSSDEQTTKIASKQKGPTFPLDLFARTDRRA